MQIKTEDAVRLGFVLGENKEQLDHTNYVDKSSFDVDVKEILIKDDNDNISRHSSVSGLESQDSAYLISKQYIRVPKGFIAYVFLKNRMSQRGLLALNTGIIDQDYFGPISTLILNLSKGKTPIPKDNSPEESSFFRVVFHQIDMTIDIQNDELAFPEQVLKEYEVYVSNREAELAALPRTFLNVDAIEKRISDKVTKITNDFSLDRLLKGVAVIGLLLTLMPMARDVFLSYRFDLNKHSEHRVINEYKINQLSERVKKLELELNAFQKESGLNKPTDSAASETKTVITQNFSLTPLDNSSRARTNEELVETIFSK
ncbi:Deoxycytidine triphosphate deaminase [Vibrio jasicida]|uniref:Deoxycytidine triphosphate deaminase n=1 Tax=Vibrio jasicida TaxID=766224 RepID=A0AAU9QLL5_9VIBR|nr:Deoxycytidine triphosphate deaminase [Vibrio jasicida]CAH1592389.1 Deoxycytidine triphosphate deaminase [Vibrio jasicida]